jgi:hypothetical protein
MSSSAVVIQLTIRPQADDLAAGTFNQSEKAIVCRMADVCDNAATCPLWVKSGHYLMRAAHRLVKKHLIHSENYFQQDKRYDYSFQAQRTFSVNNIGQSLSCVRDHGELSRQKIGTLF